MRSNKKVIFEILVIVGFLSVLFSVVYLGFLTCMQNPIDSFIKIRNWLLSFFSQFTLHNDEEVRVFIIMTSILLIIVILACFSGSIIHETGHLIVYKILGEEAYIVKKPKNEGYGWKTIPKTNNFNEKLKENNPKKYIYLCLSGVFFSTVISIVLVFITALSIRNNLSWWSWILLTYTMFFGIIVLFDYRNNMWSKKPNTDGYKAREII